MKIEPHQVIGHSTGGNPTPRASLPCERILVVDDEPRLRSSVSAILTRSGYEVSGAGMGAEAISLLLESPFALVLLDLNLPDISGQKVLDAVVENQIDTSVVILSGESTFGQATQAMRKGAEDFLAKPCPPEKLLETVARCLEKRHKKWVSDQVQQRLQGSEELHRFMVNQSPDLIFLLDDQGCFSFINERSEYFLGCRVEEGLGRHFSEFILEEDLPKVNRALNPQAEISRSRAGVELRLKPQSGEAVTYVEMWTLPVDLTALGIDSRRKTEGGNYCIARDIGDRKQAERLRRFHFYHDQLTSLPNRTLFNDRLQVAIRQARRLNQNLAVMFLDIDRFKLINDSLGHLAGDELLQTVAQKLQGCVREGDTLARISGDEFNLLLPNITTPEGVKLVAGKIQDAFSQPIRVQGREARVTFSIGCAVYPHHGESKEVLLRNADVSLYRVKETGRNGFLCYSPEMDHFSRHYLDIENSLHRALQNDEFQLYYQPKYNMVSRQVVGIEALIRWKHPEKGLLLPADFMAIAEQSKLVCAIGEWVLNRACSDAATLKRLGYGRLRMAVNISPQHLEMEGFAQSVLQTVNRYPLDTSTLEIEITENSLMQDMNKSMKTLSVLAQRGITIAVDDFGTGYSSLSYLQTLPLHTLKIDRSFVKNLNAENGHGNETIITAILAITQGLNLNFIAEGVESQAQHDYLISTGCSVAQGFFYSPPLAFSDLLAVLPGDSIPPAVAGLPPG